MNRFAFMASALTIGGLSIAPVNLAALRQSERKPTKDYPVKPVPFTAVHFNDVFWAPRIEINRTVTIPFAFQKCEETGRVANLERAAAVLKGDTHDRKMPGYPFDDTDI